MLPARAAAAAAGEAPIDQNPVLADVAVQLSLVLLMASGVEPSRSGSGG